MFFVNSKSRFKSTSPKVLAYCLKFICLIVFIVLLITQLRAIELPPSGQQRQDEIFNTTSRKNKISSTLSNDLIDRDDQEATFIDSTPVQNGTISNNINLQYLTNATSTDEQQPVEDLSVSSATQHIINVPREDDIARATIAWSDYHQLLANNSVMSAAPSLAQLTAAGTATGLLVQDLMAQANDMNDQLAFRRGVGDADMDDLIDQPVGGGPRVVPISPDGSGGGNVETDVSSPPGQQMNVNEQTSLNDELLNGRFLMSPVVSSKMSSQAASQQVNSLQPESQRTSDGVAEKLPSEDSMPDSIESLMGTTDADSEYGDQQQIDNNNKQGLPSQYAMANHDDDDNDASSATGARIVPQAQQFVAASAPAVIADPDDDDAGDDDDDGRDIASAQQRSDHVRRSSVVPIVMTTRYHPQEDKHFEGKLTRNAPMFGEIEHNLVAPMRESLVDLNAAAGHYYGKKKKKIKKKKVIIKKKKKKKKKKYKKIKIVKIKKKKIKKKKPKKMKKHHHHDHGKYYMYAKVPKKKSWEFGFKKGNKKHWIERHEKGHKNKFKTKVKWYDKKSKGKGVHIWDYNHHDKKKKKHY